MSAQISSRMLLPSCPMDTVGNGRCYFRPIQQTREKWKGGEDSKTGRELLEEQVKKTTEGGGVWRDSH